MAARDALLAMALVQLAASCLLPPADGAGPAPYTEEADGKIEAASKPLAMPPDSGVDRARTAIDWLRAVYRDAGYDYDATIRQIVKDLQENRVPDASHFVFGPNLWMLSALLERCAEDGIACGACLPAEFAADVCRLPGADVTRP